MKNKFNICCRTKQEFVSVFVLAASLMLLFGLFHVSFAQIIRTNPLLVKPTPTPQRKTLVFKGAGVLQRNPETAKFGQDQQIPQSLTIAEKSAALRAVMTTNGVVVKNENFPVETYATLSSQTPYVAGKGKLTYNGYVIAVPDDYFLGVFSGYVGIYIKPDLSGRWFMIDCKVVPNVGVGGPPFRLTGPDGNTKEIAYPVDGHLQTFMVAQNTEWQEFTLERKDVWRLYSCEVTTPH